MAAGVIKKKVVLLGDGAVGKTSLVRRFVIDKFSDDYIATIGTKVTKKDLRIERPGSPVDLTVMLWDILGQKEYQQTHESSVRGARGAFVVYDISRDDTPQSLKTFWLPLLNRVVGTVPMVVCGNKVDLSPDRNAELVRLKELAGTSPHFLVSAKTGENVEESFLALGELLVQQGEDHIPQGFVAPETGAHVATLAGVVDRVMNDFCRGFGGMEAGMPIVRQQFSRAQVDINHPTKDGLRRAILLLSEVEREFRTPEDVTKNRDRRLAWLREVQ